MNQSKDLEEIKQKISEGKGKRKHIQDQLEQAQADLARHSKDLVAVDEAQIILQTVAKDTQDQFKIHIEDVVQLALDTCFPGIYDFTVEFEIKRGKTEASLFFWKGENPVDPMAESGGGVVDLASFALRISAWSLGDTNNVIVFDEPFRFLSKDLQPLAAEIVSSLSHKTGLQIIMVTHNQEFVNNSDKIFVAKISEGKTLITEREAEEWIDS